MLESVVATGTGTEAAIDGYTVAGKTGTAQIPSPNHLGYVPGAYVGSFAGFAPAQHPVLSAIVVLDHPTPIYGGAVAAPVFSTIMAYALHHFGVPTTAAAVTADSSDGRGRHGQRHRAGRSGHGRALGGPATGRPPHHPTTERSGPDVVMLADLLEGVPVAEVRGDPRATEVRAVEYDSRRVAAGALFCCVPGERTDGHAHAAEAVSRGASSLLCDHFLDLGVTQVRVAAGGVRPAMATVAAAFYGHPARSLQTVGVTGTNGKTTVTQLVRSILEADGRPTGVIGTLEGARTTPESPDLQRRLAETWRAGGPPWPWRSPPTR